MSSRAVATVVLVSTILFMSVVATVSVRAVDYSTSNVGINNVQASTTPISLPCPTGAPWLRDPNVCASRWSTFANDKSESDLAVDPTNPQHIVGMSKFFFSPKDYLFRLGWYDSEDGGKTWTSGLLPGYDVWMDTTDPTVAFDSQGNLYTLVLPFNFVIEPSGDHNWDVGHVNPEGLNDGIFLSRSLVADGSVGRVWRAPVQLAVYHSSGVGITADKQWVGADVFGKHLGSVYASWIVFDGFAENVVFSVSTDYGASFSAPQVLSKATTPKFNGDPYVFEGPEGNVYVSYDNLPPKQSFSTGSFQVVVSQDNGLTFSKPGQVVSILTDPTPFSPDTFRDGTPYTMTVNPTNGHLLMAYENYDKSTPKANIFLTESADAGQTWSKSIQVNDPGIIGDTTQPKIFAGSSGVYAVAFYDRRLACPTTDPITADIGKLNTCIDVTIQFFNSDGSFKGVNRRVTQESWDPNVAPPQPGGLSGSLTFIGDYFGGAMTTNSTGTFAHLLYVSTSASLQLNAVSGGGYNPPYQQQVYSEVAAP